VRARFALLLETSSRGAQRRGDPGERENDNAGSLRPLRRVAV